MATTINLETETSTSTSRQAQRTRRRKRERVVLIGSVLLLIAAWLIGYLNSGAEIEPLVDSVLPGVDYVEESGGYFTGYIDGQVAGYAAVGQGTGYGGPVSVLVGVNPAGDVVGIHIVEHKETPGFFRLLGRESYLEQFVGSNYEQPMRIGQDLDAVSGATMSAEAVATAIRQATRDVASHEIGARVPPDPQPIHIGVPEIVLVALFVTGYFTHKSRNGKIKKYVRWATMLTGIVVLGFIFNKPLTLSNVISLLSGYFPSWRTNLYWFLLLGGILFVTTVQGKNPYCYWFCPFGSVQESLAQLTGAKLFRPSKFRAVLEWLPRALAFAAIFLGLLFRNPGAASYEVFGTLFDLNGTLVQWVLLLLIIFSSLIFYRPWCNYLCPLGPVVDFIGAARRWGRELWQKRATQN